MSGAPGVRRIAPLTLASAADLPQRCRRCVAWELDAAAAERAGADGSAAFEKEAWLSGVLLRWGSAGRLAYVDDALAGWVGYAPPVDVPRAGAFPTSPVSGDAALLTTGWVAPRHRGSGIARMLVQSAAKDLTQRGVRALEAFGAAGDEAPPDGPHDLRASSPGCVAPAGFYEAVGFTVVRPHHRWPRLRLELRTALAWREDVEAALERILASVRAPVLTGS